MSKNTLLSLFSILLSSNLAILTEVEAEYGSIIRTDLLKKRQRLNKPETISDQLFYILQNDDLGSLSRFMSNNKDYDWNNLRPTLMTHTPNKKAQSKKSKELPEQSTGLIDCIYYDAVDCLTYLLETNKITKQGLTTKSSHGYFPLDYILNQPYASVFIKNNILNLLLSFYKEYNLKPNDFVSSTDKTKLTNHINNQIKFYQSLL